MTIEPTPTDNPTRLGTDVRHRPHAPTGPATATATMRPQLPALAHRVLRRIGSLEAWIALALRRVTGPLLRGSLAVVYVWFGALKLADVTPVADLVAASVPWLDRSWFVPFLGLVEVVLGLALLLGRFLTTISLLLVGHMAGTFLLLVMQPEIAFQHGNPMLLTTIGEFVVKNLVLASAAIAVAAWTAPPGAPGTARPRRLT
jgi:putative oxidoreductase